MKTQSPQKQGNAFEPLHYARRHQKQHIYKLKSYLPEIKPTGRQNNLLNLTKQTLGKRQMLYLDFYQGSGIKILEKSPQHEQYEDDDNQTFGKVKVMELNNLSDQCKKTLNYFSASKDHKVKRDHVRRSIFNKLHLVDRTIQETIDLQKPANHNQEYGSPRKKMYLNVAQRNRKLPKKQKYLIQKFGIVNGDHMFKVESKKSFSLRLSTPQTQRERTVSPLRPIFSQRHPKAETLAVRRRADNDNTISYSLAPQYSHQYDLHSELKNHFGGKEPNEAPKGASKQQ